MEKTISIQYTPEGAQCLSIPVCSEKEDDDQIQVLKCRIDLPMGQAPIWLRPLKFEVRAIYDGKSYQPLMNETGGFYTLDAALFMEKAQHEILYAEKRKGTRAL